MLMKIEKINDYQIRCTLNKSDLTNREIKISELAYGTEKAQALFKDMMEQASFEFGFEVDEVPLMIEAIPLSAESIMLIITKVEDPDDLDEKFANLTTNAKNISKTTTDSDTTNNSVQKLLETTTTKAQDKKFSVKDYDKIIQVYSFNSLDDVILFSKHIFMMYSGINSLYKNSKTNTYYLTLHKSSDSDDIFNEIIPIANEFGLMEKSNYVTESIYKEHYDTIIKNSAVQVLSNL